ncbi:hypothetical protein SRHO_G00141100 [Serrasalmus rhombeus]
MTKTGRRRTCSEPDLRGEMPPTPLNTVQRIHTHIARHRQQPPDPQNCPSKTALPPGYRP